jgi:hypothetical protein
MPHARSTVRPKVHKGPSTTSQTVWRMTQQQQFAIPEVALCLSLAPQRVARIVDAMHQRRIGRWRAQ